MSQIAQHFDRSVRKENCPKAVYVTHIFHFPCVLIVANTCPRVTRCVVHGFYGYRQATEVGDAGVWSLKKNFALIELLERLQYPHAATAPQWNEDTLAKEKEVNIVHMYRDYL